MEILILAVLLGLIPAAIARSKGRSFVGWWIYGALLFIVALPHALLTSSRPGSDSDVRRRAIANVAGIPMGGGKICPDCAEEVRKEARKCRFCGHQFAV